MRHEIDSISNLLRPDLTHARRNGPAHGLYRGRERLRLSGADVGRRAPELTAPSWRPSRCLHAGDVVNAPILGQAQKEKP
jgi:hypothetical protein